MTDPDFTLLPEEAFRFLVDQECSRALRYTHFFSILLIHLGPADLNLSGLTRIARIICGGLRSSDIVGILLEHHLGVILHHADVQYTDDVVARIRGDLRDQLIRPDPGSEALRVKIGRACFPSHALTAEDLFKAAQEFLLP